MDDVVEDDLRAPVSRSAPAPSRLGHGSTSFGSQPDIELAFRSPPYQHHQHHQQRPQWQGGRCHQSSTTTTFFDENAAWRDSGDRRLVVAPPPYSRRDERPGGSPIRLLFSPDHDDAESPSPPAVPSPAAAFAVPHSRPSSPRHVGALRRQAFSDERVSKPASDVNANKDWTFNDRDKVLTFNRQGLTE